MGDGELRFIADSMLGRLATWLRILGYDTLYFRDADDGRLVTLARREERILFTRDTRLLARRRDRQPRDAAPPQRRARPVVVPNFLT